MRGGRVQGAVKWAVGAAVVLAVVAGLGYAALLYLRPAVVVTEVVEAPVVQAFYSTGTVQPEREYPIKSNTAGILTEVRVDKGARVRKGDVLAVVSDPALDYKLRQAEAELREKEKLADEKTSPALADFDRRIEAATVVQEIAQREVNRVTSALERNATSQADLDRALDRLKQGWGELEATKQLREVKRIQLIKDVEVARAGVDRARWDVEQQSLRAPVDGAVLDRPVSLGTRLAINDHVMQVADVTATNLVMRAAVDEEDISQVRLDQVVKMTLYAFPGEVFEGRVTKIYDQADPDRRTFEVDVRLGKPDPRFAAGMTGELAFITATKDWALVVPSQAVQGGTVWTVANGRLARTDVEVGIRSVERAEVLSGLRPGERVMITPAGTMKEGQPVRPSFVDPATAAGLNKPAAKTDTFKGFQ